MTEKTKNKDVCEVKFCLEPTIKRRVCVRHYNQKRKTEILSMWSSQHAGGEAAIVYGVDGLIDEMASYRKRANAVDAEIKYLWEHQDEIRAKIAAETTAMDNANRRMFQENEEAIKNGTLELLVEARHKAGIV